MSSYNVLELSDRGMRFLGRNTGLARELGYKSDFTKSLLEAEEKDKEDHSIGAFRGISEDFFFEVIEPYKLVEIGPWNVKPSELVHLSNPDEVDIHEKSLEDVNDYVYARKDSEVRKILVENDDLHDAYINGDPTRGYDQDSQFANFALLKVSNEISEEDWLTQPDLARLAIENRGNLGTLISESEELRDIINTPSDEQLLSESRDRVVDAVEAEIKVNDDIVTREFLEENPRAALYLLKSNEDLELVQNDRGFARQFVSQTEHFVSILESELAGDAEALVNSHPFTEDWFESNHEFAEIVVADKYTKPENTLENYLIGKKYTYANEVLPEKLGDEYWARTAKKTIGENTIPDFLLENNSSLSRMTSLNTDVAQGLKNDSSAITSSFNSDNKLTYTNLALRGYGLGLGDRNYGDYLRLA